MYRIAIVEDEMEAAEQLRDTVTRCLKEDGKQAEILVYQNAVAFLTNYKANFDLIFMDIDMPYINGMEGAARLREIDSNTLLIFVTNMGQMAPQGYAVEAFDFVVKPVQYNTFKLKMARAFSRIAQQMDDKIAFLSQGTRFYMSAAEIHYIEVTDHQLIYHTESGDYPAYGSIGKLCAQLEPMGFYQCNSCYLVNLRYVRKVQNKRVVLPEAELTISHPRRKAFMEALSDYIGG